MRLEYPDFWQKNGVMPMLLWPLSQLYLFFGMIRKIFSRPQRLGKFVICVGNVTVGGTGKTQMIKWIAEKLVAKNISVVILTKGYGSSCRSPVLVAGNSTAKEVGDESLELSSIAPVIASSDRLKARSLIEQMNPSVILVDDGLQNYSFIKDFSILMLDPTRSVGNGKIIPSGPLREKMDSALSRVDMVVSAGDEQIKDYRLLQKIFASKARFFKASINLFPEHDLQMPYIAFCGIGNPEKFFSSLEKNGYKLIEKIRYPDHHYYSSKELQDLVAKAQSYGAKLITTAKDYTKIPNNLGVLVAYAKLDFGGEEDNVFTIIENEIFKKN